MMLSLSYLCYLCFFTSTVVISIHNRPGISPLYIQEGVQNYYRMAAVSITQGCAAYTRVGA